MKDIDAIRRENLQLLEREAGGPAEIARRIGMSQAQFTNLREGAKDSKTGKPRGMRKETARRIEASAGKPTGWLDAEHALNHAVSIPATVPVAGTSSPHAPWPFDVAQERLRVLEPRDWDMLNNTIRTVVEVREGDLRSRKSARAQA